MTIHERPFGRHLEDFQVGDVMELRAEDGSTQDFRVAGIRPYAEVGGSDLVIVTTGSEPAQPVRDVLIAAGGQISDHEAP